MNINNINAINYGRFTQSFKAKSKKFNPYYDGSKVAKGANYEILDSLDLKREKTINELREAKGIDVSEDRERLIYSRIHTALEDAKEFVKFHPQFNYDDICQELIAIIVECTDAQLSNNISSTAYGISYLSAKSNYFNKLLNNQSTEKDMQEKYAFLKMENPEEELRKKETSIMVKDIIKNSKLDKRQKTLICLRYGFLDGHSYTFEEMGERFNIGKQRTREVERKALRMLKGMIINAKGLEYEDFNI